MRGADNRLSFPRSKPEVL